MEGDIMNNDTEYKSNAISPDILEVLDVTSEGKVVSATNWKQLWNSVFNSINGIDAYCVTVNTLLLDYSVSQSELLKSFEAMSLKYDALKDGFVHYGEEPPTNKHIQFWVKPVNNTDDAAFVTQSEFKAAVFPNFEGTTLTIDLTKALAWQKSSEYFVESLHATKNIDMFEIKYGAGRLQTGNKTRIIPAGANVNIVSTCKTQGAGAAPFEVEAKVVIDTPWIEVLASQTYGEATTVKSGELVINYITSNSIPTVVFYEYSNTTDAGTIVSHHVDFAEVAEWADGNPNNEDRTGYFVCANVPMNGIVMKKATSTDDVKGVTTLYPAFAGNYSSDKVDSNGNLLPRYSYVAVLGFVPVIDNGTCTVGGRCMPDDNGCAIPSSNSMGYQVVNRIDENRVLIIIDPNGDMIQRTKAEVNQLQNDVGNKQDKFAEVTERDGILTLIAGREIHLESIDSSKDFSGWLKLLYGMAELNAYGTVTVKSSADDVKLSGRRAVDDSANINADNCRIRNLANPVFEKDAVNKSYLDGVVGDIEGVLDELHNYAQTLANGGETV